MPCLFFLFSCMFISHNTVCIYVFDQPVYTCVNNTLTARTVGTFIYIPIYSVAYIKCFNAWLNSAQPTKIWSDDASTTMHSCRRVRRRRHYGVVIYIFPTITLRVLRTMKDVWCKLNGIFYCIFSRVPEKRFAKRLPIRKVCAKRRRGKRCCRWSLSWDVATSTRWNWNELCRNCWVSWSAVGWILHSIWKHSKRSSNNWPKF